MTLPDGSGEVLSSAALDGERKYLGGLFDESATILTIKSDVEGNVYFLCNDNVVVTDKDYRETKTYSKNNELYSGSGEVYAGARSKIEKGRDIVNCILGSDHKEYYIVGDVVSFFLHPKLIDFKIVGFYKQNTSIHYDLNKINFDQCIIMPFYDIGYDPENKEDELYQKIFYSQK